MTPVKAEVSNTFKELKKECPNKGRWGGDRAKSESKRKSYQTNATVSKPTQAPVPSSC